MTKTGLLSMIVVTAVIGTLGSSFQSSAQEKPVVLKSVCAWPAENIVCSMAKKGVIDEVNRRGAGKVKIEVLGGPEVLSPFDMIPALQNGSFDMMVSTGQYYSGTYKLADVTSWINDQKAREIGKDQDVIRFVQKYFRDKTGIEILGFADLGTTMLIYTSKRPIHAISDFKGLKIRSVNAIHSMYLKEVGAASVQIPAHELLTGLERGVVDGAFRGIHQVTQFGESPYYKYALDHGINLADGFIYMSPVTWKKLPADVRELITNVSNEWDAKVWSESIRLNNEAKDEQKQKYKIEFTNPNSELAAKFKDVRKQVLGIYASDPQYGNELKSIFSKYYE